ncbi:MAG: trehalose-phosphatase [Nostocoides sp.]
MGRRVGLPEGLPQALSYAASQPCIVIATDFDGVLAPIVLDPMAARAVDGTIEDLRRLAGRPGVHVAVVSGRDLSTLSQLTGVGLDEPIRLVGSHGAESNVEGDRGALTPSQTAVLTRLKRQVRALRESARGIRIEYKPSAVVVHTRGLADAEKKVATQGATALGRQPGVHQKLGKDVVELTVVRADKGTAVMDLAAEVGADAVVYLGDDATDEDVFSRLGPHDVGIKVGDGETTARWRVDSPGQVAEVLHLL